jgi:hypothetical protein
MAASAQLILVLALAGSSLLSARAARAWAARHDPLLALVTGGIAGLACVSLAVIYASAGS